MHDARRGRAWVFRPPLDRYRSACQVCGRVFWTHAPPTDTVPPLPVCCGGTTTPLEDDEP